MPLLDDMLGYYRPALTVLLVAVAAPALAAGRAAFTVGITVDTRPDYDYANDATIHVYELAEGDHALRREGREAFGAGQGIRTRARRQA